MTIEGAIGIVMRRLRKERNLSQDNLSLISSVDRAFISNIEGGKQQPSIATIYELAKALQVSVYRIMFEVDFILGLNSPNIVKPYAIDIKLWLDGMNNQMNDKYNSNGSETILVVDDEKLVCDMISNTLEQSGYTVIQAHDGQEAIDKYRQHADVINLVIMDVVMPNKDGITAYIELKNHYPSASVLLTSGYLPEHLNKPSEFPIFPKPFNVIDLLKLIKNILNNNKLHKDSNRLTPCLE